MVNRFVTVPVVQVLVKEIEFRASNVEPYTWTVIPDVLGHRESPSANGQRE